MRSSSEPRRHPLGWRNIIFILCVSALGSAATLVPFAAHTQESKVLRVGVVSRAPITIPPYVAFKKRMAELGYEQGKNFVFDYTQTPDFADFGRAYSELLARKPDILLTCGPEFCLKSALAATSDLPIVMVAVDYNPLARGYVQSLARPSGNVTGLFFQQIALTKKRLQLMKEAFPDVKAATVFWDKISADQWQAAQSAADTLEFPVHGVELREPPYDYDRAFTQVSPEYRGALTVLASPIFTVPVRRRQPDFALQHRMPSMFFVRYYVDAGGLMSYGVNFTEMYERAAEYVDLIAKGAKPADLPIEQPTNFELVLNLNTAKALGIKFPSSILLRADDVID